MVLKELNELKWIVLRARSIGKKVVMTNGCYDVIHRGHIDILRKMSEFGDVFIVALNSDSSVKKFKGEGRPINNEEDRAFVVSGIKGVDYVVIFEEDNPLKLLDELKPDFFVKGGAGIGERIRAEKEFVESYGGKMICLDLVEGYSSSDVIERLG
ncbi:adenylyltransferase/cytidyltransferase family protein [archaeon]|jgi:D-glycero-beta-D-manno-heptose 1-phosphate adenylyltransferase|nr:adenylyltransferase/cytidyltransferase family protein [archaeon]